MAGSVHFRDQFCFIFFSTFYFVFSSVQSLSRVCLFATPWIAAHQASLSISNSQSSLKLMSIELMMPSSHLILCRPFSSCLQSFPASGSFLRSQFFTSGGQIIGISASALPVNIQNWFPLGWTGWILVFSNTTQFKSINSSVLSFLYSPTLTSIYDYWKNHSRD